MEKNNCLVTKLKSVVNNDNLEVLGAWDIVAHIPSNGKLGCWAHTANSVIAEILDDGVEFTQAGGDAELIDSKHMYLGTYYASSRGNHVTNVSERNVNIRLHNKYDIGIFSGVNFEESGLEVASAWKWFLNLEWLKFSNDSLLTGNLSEFSTLNELIEVSFTSSPNIKGDTIAFSNATKISKFTVNNCPNITINNFVSTFGSMTSLSDLTLNSSSIAEATIEAFVSAQRAAGRTSTDSPIRLRGSAFEVITYNGNPVRTYMVADTVYLSWDVSTITLSATNS